MSERGQDINKMIEEELGKLGGPTKENERPLEDKDVQEPTLAEKLANRRAREESRRADEQAAEKVRAGLSVEEEIEVVEAEKLPSDIKGKKEAEPYAEENAALLARAQEMKDSLDAGKKLDDAAQAELFRDIAEAVINEHGQDFLPAVEKLAGRYKGKEEHLTAADRAMKVVESFYPEFRKLMSDETARSPENMVSRMKKVLESRFEGLTGKEKGEGRAEKTASGKFAGDTLLEFSSRLKGGETIDPQEYNRAFDDLARGMIREKFSDLDEATVKQLLIDLTIKRGRLFNSLAARRDLNPETAANFQRMIDEDIRKMSLPRQPKDFGRIEKSSEGRLRKLFRRMFGG